MSAEARISRAELDYLLAALQAQFPQLGLGEDDVLSTFAGVRPVIAGTDGAPPSSVAREHAVWSEDGLVAIAGGKLTTFRAIALDALKQARAQLPGWDDPLDARPVFAPLPRRADVLARRLQGRYGVHAAELLASASPEELERIPGTETVWAELRWAALHEAVRHLDDLLLRRTRLGLLLRGGAEALLPRIRVLCQPLLRWDDARWEREQLDYLHLWKTRYSLPAHEPYHA
jgi:glycerol-3-phosphate dehydrogenase